MHNTTQKSNSKKPQKQAGRELPKRGSRTAKHKAKK